METELMICIELQNGSSHLVYAQEDDNLQTLKLLIYSQAKAAISGCDFWLSDRVLDDDQTLKDLDIKNGDKLTVQPRQIVYEAPQLYSSYSLASTIIDFDEPQTEQSNGGDFDDIFFDEEQDNEGSQQSNEIQYFQDVFNFQNSSELNTSAPELFRSFSFSPILKRQNFNHSC